ncbi:MAG: hypothetical protein H6506_04125 [Calditrichaeota bacterium]|nr:hypothetical protein [Calditrichota bacterium]MCB9366053.1 hypothetical protein [Calditrichota bacterium]MCB9391821.1 hypothetical protein [Calditrichota bacterium]
MSLFSGGVVSKAASPLDHYEMLFDTLLGHHYAAAEAMVHDLRTEFGTHPGVSYADASVLYAKLTDFEDTLGTGALEVAVEACLSECSAWRTRAPDSLAAEREYLTGSAYAVSGLTRHRQGKVIDGIRRLMASRDHFDRAIQLEPEFYDAYVGRGAYRYAAASNLSLLRWLPFVPTKQSGWEDLTIGLTKSRFSRFAALSAMVWLAMQEEDYALADSMVRAGLERFPDSRAFLMAKLSLEKRTGKWGAARGTALNLVRQYEQLEFNNGYEVIGLYRSLMDCSDMLGESAAAVTYARAGLSASATAYALERREETLAVLRARVERGSGK